jgi:hypothetical protein
MTRRHYLLLALAWILLSLLCWVVLRAAWG